MGRKSDNSSAKEYLGDAKFRDLVMGSIQGVIVIGLPDWQPLFVSETVARMYGYNSAEEMKKLKTLEVIVHPEDRAGLRRQDEIFKTDKAPALNEFRGVRKDGAIINVQDKVTPIEWDGKMALLATSTDITERRRAEAALSKSETRLAEAQRIAQIGSWTRDIAADVIHWSDEHYRMFGVAPLGKNIRPSEFMDLVYPEDRDAVADAVKNAIEFGKPYDIEYRIVRPDGERRTVHGRGEVIFDDNQKPRLLEGTIQDVTERKETERRFRRIAHYDALTDLPNRYLFEDRLEKAMAIANRHDQHVAVLLIDLSRFKQVNDTLGYAVGDELLKVVGTTLQEVVRASDTLARFGSDEFAVIQTELVDPQGAAILAQKIITAMGQPFELAEHQVRSGATIGIAVYPNDGTEPAQLFQNADFALESSKSKGRNTYEFFDRKMRTTLAARKNLEDDLARALEREEFVVYYQPRIELATGRITGVESLVRWRHPDRGIVLPNEFIPSAENSGLIRPLGEWVLRKACMDIAAWCDAGLPPLSMAVNLSAAQFHKTDLVGLVSQVLDESGLTPGLLELEITETLMMKERDTKVVPTLKRLRDLGVQISVDDFGTGYASLTYLRQFPVSKVKVDQSFVQGIISVAQDKAIVEAVIKLGHGLNMAVTAEGVETEEVVSFLKAWNCDEAQGYLFSKPLASDELIALLNAEAAISEAR